LLSAWKLTAMTDCPIAQERKKERDEDDPKTPEKNEPCQEKAKRSHYFRTRRKISGLKEGETKGNLGKTRPEGIA